MDHAAKRNRPGKIRGRFLPLTERLLDSEAYIQLSPQAVKMLVDVAKQYAGKNNGQLLASYSYLQKRGWKSNDMMQKARDELLKAGFLFQTVKGHRPHTASWFAVTWHPLDPHDGYNPDVMINFEFEAFIPKDQRKVAKRNYF